MTNTLALIVEDEAAIAQLIGANLKLLGIEFKIAYTGNEAISLIDENDFNLYILDRMLPDLNGVEICRYIRESKQDLHSGILFSTALSSSENIVEGLNAGADDYITKPFDIAVFQARIKSLSRRVQRNQATNEIIEYQGIRIDKSQAKVFVEDQEIKLTISEYGILVTLLASPGKVYTRQQIVDSTKGERTHITDRTIDTHVFALRKKLSIKSSAIETVRGIGYRVRNED